MLYSCATMTRVSLLLLLVACDGGFVRDPPSREPLVSQEDRELIDKIKARERAKAELASTPSRFIRAGQWDNFDSGLFTTYTRATAIEFTNTSGFDVSDIAGQLTYKTKKGAELATVPFTSTGEVRAGQTIKIKIKANEVTGAGATAEILVSSVRIIGG